MTKDDRSQRAQRFEVILDENRGRIGRVARLYADEEAEDLVQEILMQIWRSLPTYSQQAKLSTWVYRIALNTAISWKRSLHRAKRRAPAVRLPAEQLTSNASVCSENDLLKRFLRSLSEIDRAVLLMYLDDLANDEIADAMGVSSGAIRTRLSRIRERLKTWEAEDDRS